MTQAKIIENAAIASRLSSQLPKWRFEDGALRRTYLTPDWMSAVIITGAIGHLAEAAWHHPDIFLSFGRVEVALTTHDAGGVTERDFALASLIEARIAWDAAASGPFEPAPRGLLRPDKA